MKKSHDYTIHLIPDEQQGFSVFVPALPGCFSQGETEEEAISNAREAIECHIAGMRKAGEPIPDESSIRQHKVTVEHL